MSEPADPCPSITITHEQNTIVLHIDNTSTFQKYSATYSYENLPIEFRVLFQNLREFHAFLTQHSAQALRVSNGTLHISVSIVGKTKQFQLPLDKIDLSPEQLLKKQLWLLEAQISKQSSEIDSLRDSFAQKDALLEEKEKIIDTMACVLKEKDSDNMRMAGKIRQLEAQIQDLLIQQKGGKEDNPLQQSRMTEEFTPIKKLGSKTKKIKQLEQYGRKLIFRLDQTAKHYNKFRSSKQQVQKLHGPTYQLFHNEHLPREGRFYFDIRIIFIKNNNIVVGVITDKSKDEQFSFKKPNCVCYNGYDGSVCEQEKQKYVNVKPKEGNKIRTVVDMTNSTIEWHIMGGQLQKNCIGKASIPPSMTKQPLFPYFELYWQGNKVKLNS